MPLALTALLAVAYPRLRAGARGAAAVTAGPLMIVAGVVDGARHVAVDWLTGDDVTAILVGVMGVVLVALGALELGARGGSTSDGCGATRVARWSSPWRRSPDSSS